MTFLYLVFEKEQIVSVNEKQSKGQFKQVLVRELGRTLKLVTITFI